MIHKNNRKPILVPCRRCGAKPEKTKSGFSFVKFKIACPNCKQPFGQHYRYAAAVDEWNKLNTEQEQ